MAISDLYSSGKHKQEIGHFASIVKVAKADEIITECEQKLLDKTARNLNISEIEYKAILKNPEKYPVNPPASYDERIERLHRITRMLLVDSVTNKEQIVLMHKIAVALHIPSENVEKVCNEAINLVMKKTDLDIFIAAIKKINTL